MSNAAGVLSSVLMTLPLIAVPCLAVFGLPSIGPAQAEAEEDASIQLGGSGDTSAGELGPAAAAPTTAPPAGFGPIVDAARTTASGAEPSPFAEVYAADRSAIAPTSDHRGAAANMAVGLDDRPAANAAPPAEPFARTRPAATAPAARDTGYEEIVAKLRSLGVERVALAQGELPGEVHVSCGYGAGGFVRRRFEAEAESPEAAAAEVLAQVEQWLATR
jgi:hypothetical protein